ncbi:MAG: hypothetical protein ACI3Y5_01590 [Prevotella sp.]
MKKIYQKPELTVIPMDEHYLMGISAEEYSDQDFAKKNNSGLFDNEDNSDDKSSRPFHEYLWE